MTDQEGGLGAVGLPIGEAARRLLRLRGLDGAVALSDVLFAWEDVVGPVVAAHARPRALRAEILVVDVDEPAWATELQFLSARILAQLAERLRGPVPVGMKLQVGRGGSDASSQQK